MTDFASNTQNITEILTTDLSWQLGFAGCEYDGLLMTSSNLNGVLLRLCSLISANSAAISANSSAIAGNNGLLSFQVDGADFVLTESGTTEIARIDMTPLLRGIGALRLTGVGTYDAVNSLLELQFNDGSSVQVNMSAVVQAATQRTLDNHFRASSFSVVNALNTQAFISPFPLGSDVIVVAGGDTTIISSDENGFTYNTSSPLGSTLNYIAMTRN